MSGEESTGKPAPRSAGRPSEQQPTGQQSTEGASRRRMLTGVGALAGAGIVAVAGAQPAQATATYGGEYFSYGPERWLDTRNTGGPLSAGQTRLFSFAAFAGYTLFFNLTVVITAGSGYLALYDSDLSSRPAPFSSINWQGAGRIVANFAPVALGAAGFKVYCGGAAGTKTNYILDLVGFAYAASPAAAAKQDTFRREVRRQLGPDAGR